MVVEDVETTNATGAPHSEQSEAVGTPTVERRGRIGQRRHVVFREVATALWPCCCSSQSATRAARIAARITRFPSPNSTRSCSTGLSPSSAVICSEPENTRDIGVARHLTRLDRALDPVGQGDLPG